jgi:hypothetical protein
MVNALQAVLDRAAKTSDAEPPARTTPKAVPRAKAAKAKPLAQTPIETSAAPTAFHRPVRDGKRFVGGHFHPDVARQLRMIAAEDDTTIQALMEEAVDLLFAKKGRATIASRISE